MIKFAKAPVDGGRGVSAVVFMALAAMLCASAPAATRTWTNNVVNTPATAYNWSDSGNWKDGMVPNAYDKAVLPSTALYINLPDGVVASNVTIGATYLMGSKLRIEGNASGIRPGLSAANGCLFADLELGKLNGLDPWISSTGNGINIAGRTIAVDAHYIPAGGMISQRLDYFANSSNPVRTDDIQIAADKMFFPGSASCMVFAPKGSAECTGTWSQTAGSPFISLVGASHTLAVGTIVTGDGIPDGTFLKRVFSSSWVELSAAPTNTIAENTLTFAAFSPDVRIHVPAFQRQGTGSYRFVLVKWREQDSMRFEMDATRWYQGQLDNLGVYDSEMGTYYSGTYVFHSVPVPSGNRPVLRLYNADIELAGLAGGGATEFSELMGVTIPNAASITRITVTNNISGVINTFTNFNGTLVKRGAGTLAVGFGNASNKGVLKVEGGTFEIRAKASAGTGPIGLGGLVVAAGATLVLPVCGVKVPMSACSIEAGAVVSGEGRLVVTGGAADNYVHELGEGEVAGHPMFWLDASKTNTMTLAYEDDGIYLTRWNDCREGEPMFCTNMIRRPRLVWGDVMTNRYVKLTRITDTSLHTNTEALVWSVPVGGIKAVFLVQDPTDGGGEILGRTMRLPHGQYYGSQGGPYYRGWGGWGSTLVNSSYATDCVKYGRFFLNGQEVVGYEKGYLGAYMQLLEHHVNTNYSANANHKELWLDAIGINYLDNNQNGKGCNGAMRIAECIIYTNSLTHAERVRTAQYLSRKWLGKDIAYSDTDAALVCPVFAPNGGAVDVEADMTAALGAVEGEGGLVKTGAGRLVVDSLAAGAVSVDGGELLVKSLSVSNTSVAANAWLHIDAADASTLTTYSVNGTNFVSTWSSLTENGQKVVRHSTLADKDAFIRPNATNGLPMVDLGPALKNGPSQADSCILSIQKADGSQYIHSNSYADYLSSPYLRTMFIMHSSSGGGGALLGAYSQGYPYYSFPHDYTRADSAVISIPAADSKYNSSLLELSNTYVNATHDWRWNGGTEFNPFTQPFTGGCDLLAWRSANATRPRKAAELAVYGQGRSGAGGLAYGEVLMYERILTKDEFNAVEAYLLKKWLDKDTPGYRVANVGSLVVADGAAVTLGDYAPAKGRDGYVSGAGCMEARSLGGGGTVNGSVKLLTGGGLTAVVDESGAVEGLAVNGAVDLTAGGEVVFTGHVDRLRPGRYALVTATSLAFGGEWTCESPSKSLSTSLRASGDTVYLNVATVGTMLLFK